MVSTHGKPHKPRSLPSFVANCLCERHNGELSVLDDALIDLLNGLRELAFEGNDRAERVRRSGTVPPTEEFTMNGQFVERAFLKTFIDMAHGELGRDMAWRPDPEHVEMVFGTRPHPDGAGFGMMAVVGATAAGVDNAANRFRFQPLRSADGQLWGARFEMRGWVFGYSWQPHPPRTGMTWHPNEVNYPEAGMRLVFDWSGGEAVDRRLRALTKKYPAPAR